MQIATTRPGLELRSLVPDDAYAYATLLQANADHLTRHGDYVDEIGISADEYAAEFAKCDPLRDFGIYEDGVLVGAAALVLGEPPKYGLGYLLAERACGRGIATLSVHALARHARARLDATDLFAGVTHGNHASAAVLKRLGFRRIASFESYARYHLELSRLG
ncbi:GNAT family N-acetyltransferase [Amycolatopsis anabasis]|uniref:GNAT family N-acetyltransferase n=1 Tax=Amycolatopsis anabasis TaxID=1840409 RepID=UPI00131D18E3|nr:GNAT family N-acetyltransferase [Amycolatopsis anabasis]